MPTFFFILTLLLPGQAPLSFPVPVTSLAACNAMRDTFLATFDIKANAPAEKVAVGCQAIPVPTAPTTTPQSAPPSRSDRNGA